MGSTGWSRKKSGFDRVRKFFHGSGIAWWTPLVGKADAADLEYLRAAILRDLAWVQGFTDRTDALDRVERDLSALVDWGDDEADDADAESRLLPVRYPWHIASGWTDYGATRLALLAALPAEARPSALAEMRSMEPLVLAGSRAKWNAQATELENKLAVAPTDPTIPHRLQALWREIDFGRNQFRVRVAKNTTITGLTWSVLLVALLGVCMILQHKADKDAPTCVWLVALLGLLGGAMSALRSTDMIGGERRSIELEAARVRLRPLVGAAMGVVVYVIGRSNLVFELVVGAAPKSNAPIQIKVPDIAIAYYAFAFVAGFAERWFLKIIDLVEGRTEAPPPAARTGGKGGGGGGDGGEVDAAVIKAHDATVAAKDAEEALAAAKKAHTEAEKAKQVVPPAVAAAKATADKLAAKATAAKAAAAKAKADLAKKPDDSELQKASDAAAELESSTAAEAAAATTELQQLEAEAAAKADKAIADAAAAIKAAETRLAAAKDYATKADAARDALVAVAKAEVAASAESTKAVKTKATETAAADKEAKKARAKKAKETPAKDDPKPPPK